MPDPTYGTTAEVARNVKALFPTGFGAATVPALTDVETQLSNYQAKVRQLLKRQLGGTLPAADSDAGKIASAAVVSGTTAWVLAVALAGREGGASEVKRWELQYQDSLRQLREAPDEAAETVEQQTRLRYDDTTVRREGRWTDDQLAGLEPMW